MYKNILVINMLHIGDLLLATPVLRTLRCNYPEAHIALLADAKIDGLVRYNRHIDELISVDKKGYHNKLGNFARLIAAIWKRKFDLVINLHANERASVIAAFSGAGKVVGYSSPGFGIFFNHLVSNKNFDRKIKNHPDVMHQAKEHLHMLETTLGIKTIDDQGLEMWLDEETEERASQLWAEAFPAVDFPVVGFNTGASWPSKRWTTAGFAAVADELLARGIGVAFFGGPMDEGNVREILGQMRHSQDSRAVVFTGKVNLLELAALIKKCAVFLTNDSGPMHVAIAQKAQVVSIWGSSNEVGFGPYDPSAAVVKTDIECRPCGQHNCEHHSCMTRISPGEVLQAVLRFIPGQGLATQRPAVFFDRDGVLDIDHGYVYRPEDFQWMPGAIEAIRYFNEQGYLVFVVTNQSGVARGFYKEEDVQKLHAWMNEELGRQGSHIDAFYYCPHYLEGTIPDYMMTCQCRKPEAGMLLQAMDEWPVDKERSLLIGDRQSDIDAADRAGIKGYLFDGGNLLEFVTHFLLP